MTAAKKAQRTPGPYSAIQGYNDKPGDRRIVVDAIGERVAECRDADARGRGRAGALPERRRRSQGGSMRDDLNAARGILMGLALGTAIWGVVLWAALL